MFEVEFSDEATDDLSRLFEAILNRELNSATGDLSLPGQVISTIQSSIELLKRSPFSCRKAGDDPLLRELIIDFGRTGYVALFKILNRQRVVVLAIRHQLEDDYH